MKDTAHSSAIFTPLFERFPCWCPNQMFNNYSALCYTAFIEKNVYGCSDSCLTEVTEGIAMLLESC